MSAKPTGAAKGENKSLATNRKALHDYEVLQRLECGLALRGTEVKVLRAGKASLAGSYASVDKVSNEVWLEGVNIPTYEFGNINNHDAHRRRKLLLHHREILRLREHVEQKGNTLVPLSLYLKGGRVKCELGVCRGKVEYDKRETIRKRDADLDARRAMAHAIKRG